MQPLHGAALRIGKRAHVAGDLVDGDILGGNDGLDARLLDEVYVARTRHLGQHLLHTGALRGERHEEVFLITAREGNESVAIEDILRLEQLVIGAVAVNNGGLGELFGKRETLLLVLFHDCQMRAGVLDLPGEIQRNAAAAEDRHAADGRHRTTHAAQHAHRLRRRADGIDLVAHLRDEAAVGDDDLRTPLGGAQQQVVRVLPVILKQRFAGKAVGRRDLEADQLDKTAGKAFHAERSRHAEDPRDLLRAGEFGVDDHVKPDLAAQDRRVAEVFGVAHARDRVLGAELFRHQAADEVRLVVFGNGDDEVRLAHTRAQQHAGAGAVALHTHDVQGILGALERVRIQVNQRQVMFFACHLFCDRIADFADTHNNDFHSGSS